MPDDVQINLDDFGDVLGMSDVAKILGVHLDTARRYVREGVVPSHRLPGGRRYYVLKEDLVETLRGAPGPSAVSRDPRPPTSDS